MSKVKIHPVNNADKFTHVNGKRVVGYFWLGSEKHKEYHIVINVTYMPSFWHRLRMFIAGYNFKRLQNN